MSQQGDPGIECQPSPDNSRHILVKIHGAPGTVYEGGVFNLEMFLPTDYPMEPPKILFRTKIFHPNIDKLGRICMDILKPDKWSPALMIRTVLLSVQSLMSGPNLDDPLDAQIADVFRHDLELAQKTAREWTKLYASEK